MLFVLLIVFRDDGCGCIEERTNLSGCSCNLWDNVTGKKMYITGGIGSTRHGEAFGKNYDCPTVQPTAKLVLSCQLYVESEDVHATR